MLMHKFFAVMMLFSALLAPGFSQAAPVYIASFLPGADFAPTGMNNAGQIVGFAGTGAVAIHTVLYDGGMLSDLGSMGGRDSYALAINDAGDLTGSLVTANGEEHAFLYRNGQVTDLGGGTVGYGINARADIVGKKQTAMGWTGFLFSDGKLTEIANLDTGLDGCAVGINDHGQIVGESRIAAEMPAPTRHPYLYRQGVMTDLGALSDGDNNGAVAINNRGQVAGYSEGADGVMHAFLYQHGALQDLGSLGDAELTIHDLNEHGTLVGTASNEDDGLVPFMNLDGALVDLNTLLDPALGWHIYSAYANNDLGQIVGYGCRDAACGLVRLDLASAVPAPGGALLLLAGLPTLARARQRQHGRRAAAHAMQRRTA
ncbi:hypothetical protein [Massilia sp. S19_KUP03_FR1]|uniref:hypothetical protein n=1 Tax=Massilia sp. S19_KUP03_FR1 TaxID=3025503 RepID=UPI002FCDB4DA